MNAPTANEVKQAVQALKINKPIMKITKHGKTLTFYLYGGQVLKYRLRSASDSWTAGR
jgi:hypothetical protein